MPMPAGQVGRESAAMIVGGGVGLLSRAYQGSEVRADEPCLLTPDADPAWREIDAPWIAGGATIAEVAANSRIAAHWPALASAARSIANPGLRRRITVGGVVAARLVGSDLAVPLCAYRASVLIVGPTGVYEVPILDYLRDGPAGLVWGVTLGAPAHGVYRRVAVRSGPAPALAIVCIVEGSRTPRIWAGAVARTPVELGPDGVIPGDVDVLDDHRASAAYRSAVVQRLVVELRDTVPSASSVDVIAPTARHAPVRRSPVPSLAPMAAVTALHVDGHELELTVAAPPARPLSDVLRDAGIYSVKLGCEEGVCGACTVQLDGEPVPSCVVPVGCAVGRTVHTAASLVDTIWGRRFVDALHASSALQCGFCAPGFVVAASAMLRDAVEDLDPVQCAEMLSGQLCRCSGGWPLVDAVVAAGTPDRTDAGVHT